MTDKSDVVGLETTAEERARWMSFYSSGAERANSFGRLIRDFDRLTAALASERERAEKAERERAEADKKYRETLSLLNDSMASGWGTGMDAIALARRVTELEGALCFYAEPARYTPEGVCMKDHGPYVGPEADRGEHARAVLKKKENAGG